MPGKRIENYNGNFLSDGIEEESNYRFFQCSVMIGKSFAL